MSQFPEEGVLSSASRSQGEMKTYLEAWLAACKQVLGSAAETKLTIASGAVTPVAGVHNIDTEGAASADDLSLIVQDNLPDGSMLMIRCSDADRVVTVVHGAGGTGQILLTGSADADLDDTSKWLLLKRTGTAWEEVGRMGWPADVSSTAIQTWTKPQKVTRAVLSSSSGAVNLDLSSAAAYRLPLTEDTTFGQPTNFPTGEDIIPFTVDLIQHASSAKTVALNETYFKTPNNAAFSMPADLGSRTRLYCIALPDGYVDVVDVQKFS